jgi:hypothetical protein
MINKLAIRKGITEVTYHRPPTKSEIKFGYGAIHYRDFDLNECLDKEGYLKMIFKSKDDGLIYFSR